MLYAVARSLVFVTLVGAGVAQETGCHDDPTYEDGGWHCAAWVQEDMAEGCRAGYPPVDTPERIAALVHACPVSCPDVTPICGGDTGSDETPSPSPPPPIPSPIMPPSPPPGPGYPVANTSGQYALPILNTYRSMHCDTPPLEWEPKLANAAQAYADSCPTGPDHALGSDAVDIIAYEGMGYVWLAESSVRWQQGIMEWYDQGRNYNCACPRASPRAAPTLRLRHVYVPC